MEETKYIMPESGCIGFLDGDAMVLPKPRVIKCGNKNKHNAPIEVKRTIRPGFRTLRAGESINWRQEYR